MKQIKEIIELLETKERVVMHEVLCEDNETEDINILVGKRIAFREIITELKIRYGMVK